MKTKTQFVCSQCAAIFKQWAGQCTQCGAWNSISEEGVVPAIVTHAVGNGRINVR